MEKPENSHYMTDGDPQVMIPEKHPYSSLAK